MMWSTLRRVLPGVDLDELSSLGRPLFEQRPRMLTEAARTIADRWPGVEPRWLGDALSVQALAARTSAAARRPDRTAPSI
ncbi:hypothetical protein JQS43_15155 [Natronosporangium hydrolyticum]|uniref:Uncharacterized protein n=1 Tax=Natronosporangium hydrolyticum TaxID=2811111 RepID=A0A895Y5L7_9ACTN|nr:hypothetical protein [Natronosporangium hydrolyticum]QSB12994.1 hypothetical protein JQS43_15155 [Natronosporangium hydrolyticum]